jgi:hypothetical protein
MNKWQFLFITMIFTKHNFVWLVIVSVAWFGAGVTYCVNRLYYWLFPHRKWNLLLSLTRKEEDADNFLVDRVREFCTRLRLRYGTR